MNMFLIRNVFLVEVVDVYLLLSVSSPKEEKKIALELIAVVGDMLARVLADQ